VKNADNNSGIPTSITVALNGGRANTMDAITTTARKNYTCTFPFSFSVDLWGTFLLTHGMKKNQALSRIGMYSSDTDSLSREMCFVDVNCSPLVHTV